MPSEEWVLPAAVVMLNFGANHQMPQNNLAIARGVLTAALLDCLDTFPNVNLFFNHKLVSADFHKGIALFEDRDWLCHSMEVRFDIMLGADGAHSAVRYDMMKVSRMDYQHEYIDILWCEFRMKPSQVRNHAALAWKISPSHLHIWPAGDSMFIAIPNNVRSFELFIRESSSFVVTDLLRTVL